MFDVGDRVKLHSLSSEELNGIIAVVLAPSGPDEEEQLNSSGRTKVSHYPKALSLKPEKLASAPSPNYEIQPLPFTVLQVVQHDEVVAKICKEAMDAADAGEEFDLIRRLCGLTDPEEFAVSLWNVYGNTEPAQALPDNLKEMTLDRPGHRLYWIGLEQLGHHMIIEACDGTWRGFQAFQRTTAPEAPKEPGFKGFGGVLLESNDSEKTRGYSAQEWASEDSVGVETAAHKLWGGGKTLQRKDAEEVLQIVLSLKDQVQAIARHLADQLTHLDDAGAAELAANRLEAGHIDMTPDKPGTPRSCPGYAEVDGVYIFNVEGYGSAPWDMTVSSKLAFPFMRDYAKLTGEFPGGEVFIKALSYVLWKDQLMEDGSKVGWTFRSVTLRDR